MQRTYFDVVSALHQTASRLGHIPSVEEWTQDESLPSLYMVRSFWQNRTWPQIMNTVFGSDYYKPSDRGT